MLSPYLSDICKDFLFKGGHIPSSRGWDWDIIFWGALFKVQLLRVRWGLKSWCLPSLGPQLQTCDPVWPLSCEENALKAQEGTESWLV